VKKAKQKQKNPITWMRKSRSPKAKATAQHNRDKTLKTPTPRGEDKRFDTIGKIAKHKAPSGDTKSSQCMNASSPWTNMWKLKFSTWTEYPFLKKRFLPLDAESLPLDMQTELDAHIPPCC
jgi:hypothetical protein